MTVLRCSVAGCGEPVWWRVPRRGWCQLHYGRWRRYGDPLEHGGVIVGDDAARFWSKVHKTEGCWWWTGGRFTDKYSGGYGQFAVGRKPVRAHRYAYELLRGPIPAGMTLDHLCHSADPDCPGCPHRACVNPAHLEPVPGEENTRRGRRWQLRKTHCPRGHPYDQANTYTDPIGRRNCRACDRDKARRRRATRRALAVEAPPDGGGAGGGTT